MDNSRAQVLVMKLMGVRNHVAFVAQRSAWLYPEYQQQVPERVRRLLDFMKSTKLSSWWSV